MYDLINYTGLKIIKESLSLEEGLILMKEGNKITRTCYLAPHQ